VYSPAVLKSSAPASWLPICLPKFNPTGIVYSYVSFFRRDQDPPNETGSPAGDAQDGPSEDIDRNIALVCIGGSDDHETIRNWCNMAVLKLEADGTLDQAVRYISSGATEYTVGELSVPGLRHFLYKARAQVQVTSPSFEDPYDDLNEQRRFVISKGNLNHELTLI
jgi:vacuolar fusion protein MON1